MKHVFVLASALLMSSAAYAQPEGQAQPPPDEEYDMPSEGYPSNFTQRPITLPAMTIKADLGFAVVHFGEVIDSLVLMNLGGAFGILDDLEVGVSGDRQGLQRTSVNGLVPLVLAPDFDIGDIYLYGRYRFLNTGTFQMGVEIGFNIPTFTDFGFLVAAPFRLRLGEMFSLDGGIEFLTSLGDPDSLSNPDTTFALRTTIQPRFAPVDFLYFGVDFGLASTFTNSKALTIALGFEAGYVIDLDTVKIDAYLNFSFPTLYGSFDTGPSGREGTTVPEFWQLLIGARAFIGLDH